MNRYAPNKLKNKAMLASKAGRENCKCQGEIARKKLDKYASHLFLKNSKTNK